MSADAASPFSVNAEPRWRPKSEKPSVWLFPGLGSRFVGMGGDVLGKFPAAEELAAEANEFLGWDVIAACLEGAGRKIVSPRQESQLIYVVSCVYAAVLSDHGQHPTAVCGHSLGTWAAAHAAGTFDFRTGLELVSHVEELLESRLDESGQCMGLVIGLPEEILNQICAGECDTYLANFNSPGQYVIGGSTVGVERALAAAQQAGAYKVKSLPIARAMHTPLLGHLSGPVGQLLMAVAMRPPQVPLVNAWDGSKLTGIEEIRRYLRDFMFQPVRWETAMRRLLVEPCTSFMDVGPAAVLSGMMQFLDRSVHVPTASEILKNAKRAKAEGAA